MKAVGLPQLIAGLVMLVLAILVVFVPPVAAVIPAILQFLAPIAAAFGIVDFRKKYGLVKEWVQSKTIWGVLVVVLPLIALMLFPFIGFEPAEWLLWVLRALIVGGGGTILYGIFDAAQKNPFTIPAESKHLVK
jgi:hypothetical protein